MSKLSPNEQVPLEFAAKVTIAQIQKAREIFISQFNGHAGQEGVYIPAILQALATNYAGIICSGE